MESSSTALGSSDVLKSDSLPIAIVPPLYGSKRKRVTILKPDELRQKFMPTLERMYQQEPECNPFRQPVDPILLGIPDYFDIIKKPIDLSVIKRKLDLSQYQHPWEFLNDVWLMFDNAWLYNKKSSRVYRYCTKLADFFEQEIHPVMRSMGYCCGRKCCCYQNTTKQEGRVKRNYSESGSGPNAEKKRELKMNYFETKQKLIMESSGATAGSKSNDSPIAVISPLHGSQPKRVCKYNPRELRQKLMPTLKRLYHKVPESYPFRQAVDPIALGIPDYFDIIKRPMDLSLIKRKLDLSQYQNPWEFVDDVCLMLENAWLYNRKSSRVYRYSKKLAAVFEQDITAVMQSIL